MPLMNTISTKRYTDGPARTFSPVPDGEPITASDCVVCRAQGSMRFARDLTHYYPVLGERPEGLLVVDANVADYNGAAEANSVVCQACWISHPADLPVVFVEPWQREAFR